MVVDTGFNGSVVEIVASAVRHFKLNIKVRGVLLGKNPPQLLHNTIPIDALAISGYDKPPFDPIWWAYFFDEGVPRASSDFLAENYAFYDSRGFMRSRRSAKQLVLIDGRWQPDTAPLLPDQRTALADWTRAVVGFWDGAHK